MIRPIKSIRLPALLLALCLLAGCAGSPARHASGSARYQVALVAKSTKTDFWKAVFVGAEAAATEYNLDLTITGPETEEDYETQNEMIAEAVENGAQALVFSAIDFDANAPAIEAAAGQGVEIVVIDSAVNSENVATYIGTDNYSAGKMAAEAALEGVPGTLRVGIVNYDINSANGQDRERGAVDTFEQRPQRDRGDHPYPGGSQQRPPGYAGHAARTPGDQRAAGLQRAHQRGRGPGRAGNAPGQRAVYGGVRLQPGDH